MRKKSAQTQKVSSVKQVTSQTHKLAGLFIGVCMFVAFLATYFHWQMQQIGIRLQQLEGSSTQTSQLP